MLTSLVVIALFAAPAAPPVARVDVMSNHAVRALDEGVYLHIVAAPLKARVERKAAGDLLEIDIVRFGPSAGPLEGASAVLVEVGGQSTTLPIRAALETERKAGDALVASYPVRHRFPLGEGVTDVVIVVVQGASGVGVQLRATEKASSGDPALVPLEPALEPLEPLEPVEPVGPALVPLEPLEATPPETTPETVTEQAPPASASSSSPPAAAASEPAPSPPPTAVVELPPSDVDVSASSKEGLRFPARFSAQVGVGGMVQLAGGLAPSLLSGGVRVVTGVRQGWMSRYALGAALDFEHQAARTTAQDSIDARWDATATRLRLEGQAGLLEVDLGFAPLDVTLLGGAGMVLGAHTFRIDGVTESALLLGPTFRVGAQAGLRIGPGAIVALVPVDLSFDAVAGRVQRFAPLATSLYLGYRLDL